MFRLPQPFVFAAAFTVMVAGAAVPPAFAQGTSASEAVSESATSTRQDQDATSLNPSATPEPTPDPTVTPEPTPVVIDPGDTGPKSPVPNVYVWTPPAERSQGSLISQRIADHQRELAGEDFLRPEFAIANEGSWPDALIAANTGGTVLLNEAEDLEPSTKGVLANTLRAHTAAGGKTPLVYLVGGEAALGPRIEQQIKDLGYDTVRLGGPSRIETSAANVARRWWPGQYHLVITRASANQDEDESAAFADTFTALQSASPHAILLSSSDQVHPAVTTVLADPPRGSFLATPETRLSILGGENAISPEVEAVISRISRKVYTLGDDKTWAPVETTGYTIDRIQGDSRFSTNVRAQSARIEAINDRQAEQNQPEQLSFPIVVLDGKGPYAWQTAYSAASLYRNKVMLLTNGDELLPGVVDLLEEHADPSPETPVICYSTQAACATVVELVSTPVESKARSMMADTLRRAYEQKIEQAKQAAAPKPARR